MSMDWPYIIVIVEKYSERLPYKWIHYVCHMEV